MIESLTNGSAVHLTGQWTASPNSKAQSCELHVKDVTLLGPSDPAVCEEADVPERNRIANRL
jgi:hypothetical protein